MNRSQLLSTVVTNMELTMTLGGARMYMNLALSLLSEMETESEQKAMMAYKVKEMLEQLDQMEESLGNEGQDAADKILEDDRCASCPGSEGGCCRV